MKNKQEILAATDLPTMTVEIPEWGGAVTVTTLKAIDSERMHLAWKALGRPKGDYSGFGSWVVAHTVLDEAGNKFFDPSKDFEALQLQPAHVVSRLFDAACKLNALTKSDQDELVKN